MMTEQCWCGGEVGPRDPGDNRGLGCLENIWHDWNGIGELEFLSQEIFDKLDVLSTTQLAGFYQQWCT